ncbi:MAG: hypothetical protein F6K57_39310, partial [Moorea sp. SIO4A5]|nr:hypothetical protein [Moorena sp. SIO4A5]
GIGNRESGIGNRESGIGNRESGIGNRESGIGNSDQVKILFTSSFACYPKPEYFNKIGQLIRASRS